MAKIDTSTIQGYAEMSIEQKLAALEALDITPDLSGFVKKDLLDKAMSEAAGYKKALREKMSQDEQAEAQKAEQLREMQDELAELRKEKTISDMARRWQTVGYSNELALATATAMEAGDMDTVFKNHAQFVSEHDKALKAELLKQTPTPPPGSGSMTKAEYDKKAAEAQAAGNFSEAAYYIRLANQAVQTT